MKNYVCLTVAVFLWCALMPLMLHSTKQGQASVVMADGVVNSDEASVESRSEIFVRYYDINNDEVSEIELEEYVARALSALMPECYEEEALKAQAVAIRSVICYRHENVEHEGYELCGEGEHCFELADNAFNEHRQATEDTAGEILTYEGNAALALSHDSSCVKTENYETLYGTKIPYLTSVAVFDESVFDEHKTVTEVSLSDFKDAFSGYNVRFEGESDSWISEIEYTAGNRVYTINIGGLCFKGSTFARLLKLDSLCYTVETEEEGFIISSYGKGDGVGMSRYSAILMAEQGKAYKDILAYFYPNTKLSCIASA